MLKLARLSAAMTSVVLFAVVLTFPEYFLFNPWQYGWNPMAVLQIFSTISWLLLLLTPLLFIGVSEVRGPRATVILLALLFWPFMVTVIRLYLLLTLGNPGFGYMIDAPIFALTDLLLPVLTASIVWRARAKRVLMEVAPHPSQVFTS